MSTPHAPPNLIARGLAEALGTALLVATIVGSGIMAERLAGGNSALALLGNTLPTGAILIVVITILGPVSGAHFNPVVSTFLAMRGAFAWRDVPLYVIGQVVGGVLGTLLAHAMFEMPLLAASPILRGGTGQWIGEICATLTLIIVISGALRHAPDKVAMLVGLTITAAYWFTSSTSFANPAVTIARALTPSFAGIAPASAPGFILAQVIGMMLALPLASALYGRDIKPAAPAT